VGWSLAAVGRLSAALPVASRLALVRVLAVGLPSVALVFPGRQRRSERALSAAAAAREWETASAPAA
jgi:hypothetical protein